MLSSAIIIFREVLEAALLIGILAAATRSVPNRAYWLAAGVGMGLAGAAVLAGFTDTISTMASGVGQEILNAIILTVAVVMLAWHNIWMASHGKAMAQSARAVGNAIRDGRSELSALFIVVSLAVLREGAESVLFLYGVAISGEADNNAMLAGGFIGVLAGLFTGYIIYRGLLRVPLQLLFQGTAALILLMAGGMASQATAMLTQANLVTVLTNPLWDSSALISPTSVAGVILRALTGYEAQPSGIQVIVYLLTMTLIAAGMYLADGSRRQARTANQSI